MTLTNEQKRSYDEDGFLLVRNAFTTDELNRMECGVMRAVRDAGSVEKPYPTPATQFTIEGQYQDDPDLLFIAEHPAVIEPVEPLLGGPACLSAFVSYVKTPGASGTSGDYQGSHPTGHCDYKTYQQAGSSLNWLFTIIGLTDLDEETGPLLVSPGSHKMSRIVPVNDRIKRVERASATDIAPLQDTELRRGDLLFMHMFTWHEGKANRSDHDRFGLYNKYRARNAPPACGPQLFSEKSYRAFSDSGKRLIPHHADEPVRAARLIVDRGQILLSKGEAGSWQLPGVNVSQESQRSRSMTSNIVAELETAMQQQFGLTVPWMTFVGDYPTPDGVRRVFAFTDGGPPAEVSTSQVQWTTAEEVEKLAAAGELADADLAALQCWWDEDCVRGIGESPERAKSETQSSGRSP